MTEYNIRLNPNCATVVHTGLKFKSGDKGITFVIAVDELDTTDTTAKIVFMRANGTSVESDIIGTDGVYRYKTLGNEFAVPGKTVADVKVYAADERVSTASFVFDVSADTMSGLGAGTGGYSDRLEQLVTEAEEAGELTERAKAELEAAEKNLAAKEMEISEVLKAFKEQYGEVGTLNPRGNWNSGVSYAIRDMVHYMGCSWICVVANKGNAPVEGSGYWMKNVGLEAGESGARNILPYPYYSTTSSHSGLDWTDNGDGTLSVIGTTTAITSFVLIHESKKVMLFEKGKKYTLGKTSDDNIRMVINFYDESVSIISTVFSSTEAITFEVPDAATFMRLYIRVASGATLNITLYPMLEIGSVAHDYVPYHFGGAESALELTSCLSSDLNEEYMSSGGFSVCNYNSETLNTPYKAGLSQSTSGKCITCKDSKSATNAIQMVLVHGKSEVFIRRLISGTVGDWKKINDGGNADMVDGYHASDFVRADGSVPMSGNLKLQKCDNGYGSVAKNHSATADYGTALRDYDVNGSKAFICAKASGQKAQLENDSGIYDILHTGNSNAVIKSATAPSDTTAMWYDTENNTWKRYVNGAWTAA